MWKCPKCGRTFKNENQSHFCGKSPETVDEYILAQNADIREQLQRVREAIRDELPDATEKISWSMPTWWSGHNIIHFAAQKKHIGLYPGPEAVAFFSEKLDAYGFKYSKGSIQIPYSDDLPLSLISEITAWCRDTGNHACSENILSSMDGFREWASAGRPVKLQTSMAVPAGCGMSGTALSQWRSREQRKQSIK